ALDRACALTQAPLQLGEAARAFEVEAELAETDVPQMSVGVGEPRKNGQPMKVEGLGVFRCVLARAAVGAHVNNAAGLGHEGLSVRIVLIRGVDIAVDEQFCVATGCRRSGGEQSQGNCWPRTRTSPGCSHAFRRHHPRSSLLSAAKTVAVYLHPAAGLGRGASGMLW